MKKNIFLLIVIVFIGISVLWYWLGSDKKHDTVNNETDLPVENSLSGTGESSSQINQLSQQQRIDDLKYMYNVLKDNYPFFGVNKRLYQVDWLSREQEFIDRVKATQSDDDFYYTLKSILSDLNNGHTNFIDKDFYNKLNTDINRSNLTTNKAWKEVLDNEKAKLRYDDPTHEKPNITTENYAIPGNVKTDIVSEGKVAYLGISSFNTFNIEGDIKIITPFLKKVKNYKALIIDIRGNGGGDDSYWSNNLVPLLTDRNLSCDWYFLFRGGNYAEHFIKYRLGDDYKNLQPIDNIFSEDLKNYPEEVKSDFKKYLKYKKTVPSKIYVGFQGKIYLLVDKYVYSSSEMFATFAKSTKFATLVGETTGGDGIGMEPLICVLPNSGHIFRFPNIMGLDSDGNCNEEHKTQPDIRVDTRKNDNLLKDEAVKYVLSEVK